MQSILAEKLRKVIFRNLFSNHKFWQQNYAGGDRRLFDFDFVCYDDIYIVITSLDSTKKTSGVIPTKILKLSNKEICKDLANCINESIKKNEFPNELKSSRH